MLLRFGWKQFPYCFTLAGCQNPPLPVVEKVGLGAAAERKRLTSSLTEDVCVYSLECACIFITCLHDANEDVRQLYN